MAFDMITSAAKWGWCLWACVPGPSPRIMDYSLTNGLGAVTGGLTSFILRRFVTAAPLPNETIVKAEKYVQQFKKAIQHVNGLRIGKKHLRKDQWGSSLVQTALSFSPFVAMEKAARHAANKVQVFVTRRPISIKESAGFRAIEAELKTAKIFTEVLKDKKEAVEKARKQGKDGTNVDTRIKRFYTDLETLLIKKLPATSTAPSWVDTVGFGTGWLTQLGVTWISRLTVYNLVTGLLPDHIIGKAANTLVFFGAFYVYSKGLAWYGRGQDEALRIESGKDKTDCLKYLDAKTIDEIRDLAFDKLLFDQELKDKHADKLDQLKEKLAAISTADSGDEDAGYDPDAGYESPVFQPKKEKKRKVATTPSKTTAPKTPAKADKSGAVVASSVHRADPKKKDEPPVLEAVAKDKEEFKPRPVLGGRTTATKPSETATWLKLNSYEVFKKSRGEAVEKQLKYITATYENDDTTSVGEYIKEFKRHVAVLKTYIIKATSDEDYELIGIFNRLIVEINNFINDLENPESDSPRHSPTPTSKRGVSRVLFTPSKDDAPHVGMEEVIGTGVAPSFMLSPEEPIERVVDPSSTSGLSKVFSSVKKDKE